MDWIAYLDDEELNGFHREDYYLANIAAEVRRSFVKDPAKIKMESFLIKFKKGAKLKRPKKTKEEKIRESKAFWMSLAGMPKRKK